ncbi:structural maintenance of chromosomes protein 3-like [Microplitis mediator]|uniref:structural maintenance of chromosomes protein 3-like n=1 Tax=Microplitis mediator TaxID=375433 RepID=UPI002554305D|nr:structural maintenance of chromosomes protein 3-like [Microplitis mediator]
MYIHQIIIEGFKSYQGPTAFEPFHPNYNVVVGKNGSGKSNFLKAIQFVLCDEFYHLSSKQYQDLFHKGVSSRYPSAFVEIVFNNTDRRLPISKDTVHLRRSIGQKYDNYSVNKKLISKNDVKNLLASVGLSNFNPYYIVQQRTINKLVLSSDAIRLKQLKEIAGIKVFEALREESVKEFELIERALANSNKLNDDFSKKLDLKRLESKEAKEYLRWDKERRILEYVINEKELKATEGLLRKAQDLYIEQDTEQLKIDKELKHAQQMIFESNKRLDKATQNVANAREGVNIFVIQQQKLLEIKTNITRTINYLKTTIENDQKTQENNKIKLRELENSITKYMKKLSPIKAEYESVKRREEKVTHDLIIKEQYRKELCVKKQRKREFADKSERDEWIKRQLELLDKDIQERDELRVKFEKELEEEKINRRNLESEIKNHDENIEKQLKLICDYKHKIYELEKLKDQYQDSRREFYRDKENYENELLTLREKLTKIDQSSMISNDIADGRDSLTKVLDILRQQPGRQQEVDSSYFNMVIDNFVCDNDIYNAVEAIAGNRLFNHIVATDEFGMEILDQMNRLQLPGSVTFLPLNRLPTAKRLEYPGGNESVPMMRHLHYDSEVEKAFYHIFGKTLLCRSLKDAIDIAHKHKFNCITIDAEQVSWKGDLACGSRKNRKSHLEVRKIRDKILEQIDEIDDKLMHVRENILNADNDINKNLNEICKDKIKLEKAENLLEKLNAEIEELRGKFKEIENKCGAKEKILNECLTGLELRRASREKLESELNENLLSQLSEEDQEQLDQVNDEIKTLVEEKKELVDKLASLSHEKNQIDILLEKSFQCKEKLEVDIKKLAATIEDNLCELNSSEKQVGKITEELEAISDDINKNEEIISAMEIKTQIVDEIKKWKRKEIDATKKLQKILKELNHLRIKINRYGEKILECKEKLNKMGPLPRRDVYKEFKDFSNKQLNDKLQKTSNKLKKFSHININALDHFVLFSERRDELVESKTDLERSYEDERELFSVMDEWKSDGIQYSFRKMNKCLKETFKKLVPTGSAQLVVKIRDKTKNIENISRREFDYEKFTGIGIRVSFSGEIDDIQMMNRLSGGQKSLVALAFIFAAQKCNPTSLYILDEIDHALDPTHRENVAKLIRELSSESQFITTTFRPEQVRYADKCYGVKLHNKISYLQPISQEDAADFIENDPSEN